MTGWITRDQVVNPQLHVLIRSLCAGFGGLLGFPFGDFGGLEFGPAVGGGGGGFTSTSSSTMFIGGNNCGMGGMKRTSTSTKFINGKKVSIILK